MENDEEEKQDLEQFEQLIQGLIGEEYGLCDEFLEADTIAGLRDTLIGHSTDGELFRAGIGNLLNFQKTEAVRGDEIKWLENDSQDIHEQVFLKKIARFSAYLNQTCYTSINDFESHYANYKVESFYKQHLDQFKSDSGRKYSVILYLNKDWQIKDGGNLSVFLADGKQADISPIAGRLVFFKSDHLEHEVHPSHTRSRMSIAGWLKST